MLALVVGLVLMSVGVSVRGVTPMPTHALRVSVSVGVSVSVRVRVSVRMSNHIGTKTNSRIGSTTRLITSSTANLG